MTDTLKGKVRNHVQITGNCSLRSVCGKERLGLWCSKLLELLFKFKENHVSGQYCWPFLPPLLRVELGLPLCGLSWLHTPLTGHSPNCTIINCVFTWPTSFSRTMVIYWNSLIPDTIIKSMYSKCSRNAYWMNNEWVNEWMKKQIDFQMSNLPYYFPSTPWIFYVFNWWSRCLKNSCCPLFLILLPKNIVLVSFLFPPICPSKKDLCLMVVHPV